MQFGVQETVCEGMADRVRFAAAVKTIGLLSYAFKHKLQVV